MVTSERKNRIDGTNPGSVDSQTTLHRLPEKRNPDFTGRSETFSSLAEHYFSGSRTGSVYAITGMGGIGKTQIALEFAYRFSSRYEVLWWVRADSDLGLLEDYALFAKAIDLCGHSPGSGKRIIGEVLRWMQRQQNWLFILDGARNPDQLARFLPEEINGHVLITSRHSLWDKRCPSSGVLFFPRDDSVDFLLKATGRKDSSGAVRVAERLADFPMALELACATINESRVDFAQYTTLFQSRHKALWADKELPLTYPDTVGTVVDIACEEMEARMPAAILLLHLFSHLAQDEIPSHLMSEVKECLPKQFPSLFFQRDIFDKAQATLRRYGFLGHRTGAISLHLILQEAIRDRLETVDRKMWSEKAVATVNTIFPSGHFQDPTVQQYGSPLLSHGQRALYHAVENNVALSTAADLSDSIGSYLQGRGFLSEAEPFFHQALDLFEKEKGLDHPQVGAAVHNLAALHQDQGRLDIAEKGFRRALDIYVAVLGADHPFLGSIGNNLAALLRSRGSLDEAERLFRSSLELFRKNLDRGNPQIATGLNNLAVILLDQGRFEEAERLLQEALEIYETNPAADLLFTAKALSNLAQLFLELGQVDDAEALFAKALAIREAKLPPDHPDVAANLYDLAGVYKEKGQHAEAETLYRKVLALCENKKGDTQLQVASCIMNLAKVMQQQGNHEASETLFRKGLNLRKTQLSENHPDVASGMVDLAGVLHGRDAFSDAESLYRNALRIHESLPEPNPLQTAICLNNLAVLLWDQGNTAEAEQLSRRAVRIQDEVLGADHPDTAACRYNLYLLLMELGDTEQAERLYHKIPDYFSREKM